ncbi:hypothetical protein F4V43_01835 [Paenibacillus spiritus]|uniref:Uncharacterized protein n=1 Tax=Paenibacillus spiritus TaxID=2496557 RepID=A0A5J5GGH4_9BACL|nr:hypothetical protein [Paenibacillus spiritus]KAA9007251.1 hypothetical protein F4V43_01835 [Paenibacillus spiritus]
MTKFYGVATSDNGVSVIIDNLPEVRLQAENEAIRHCAKNGLTFQYIRPAKASEEKGATLTKYKKQRDRVANKR